MRISLPGSVPGFIPTLVAGGMIALASLASGCTPSTPEYAGGGPGAATQGASMSAAAGEGSDVEPRGEGEGSGPEGDAPVRTTGGAAAARASGTGASGTGAAGAQTSRAGAVAGGTESPREPRVLVMGTSLTEGLGLEDPGSEAWPAQLALLAEEAGVEIEVRNAGLSGETSAGALRRLGWVLGEVPDVFVLETGANDGLRGLPVAELEANLDAIFRQVREAAPGIPLVLAGMEAPTNLGPAYTDAFQGTFERVAARWDAELIPFLLEGVAAVPELNQADRIHPTAEGHQRMAEVAWPAVRRAVARLP